METLEILYAAPVPVGHRVELRWYEAPIGGFFGNKLEVRPHEPRLVDLDTGVTYAPGWMYAETEGVRPLKAQALLAEMRPGLREGRVLVGVVRACRVTTFNGGDGAALVQTSLTVGE
jgi:hypothetical protein